MSDRPMQRKYARLELERRFLLTALPPGVDTNNFVRLRDLFVTGAGLRVRRVEDVAGREVITKLGQKLPDPAAPDAPGRNLLTTIYLSPGEDSALRDLPGPTSCKRRYTLEEQGWTWAIDVWEEPSQRAGLILAEVECPSLEELAGIVMPPWAEQEVTTMTAYSAFALATQAV